MSTKSSKRRIECWYCSLELLRCSLKKHTEDQHPGKPPREKDARSIKNYFMPAAKKSKLKPVAPSSNDVKNSSVEPNVDKQSEQNPGMISSIFNSLKSILVS